MLASDPQLTAVVVPGSVGAHELAMALALNTILRPIPLVVPARGLSVALGRNTAHGAQPWQKRHRARRSSTFLRA
jgi:hypothetical protein